MTHGLSSQKASRHATQIVVHQRDELIRRVRISRRSGFQEKRRVDGRLVYHGEGHRNLDGPILAGVDFLGEACVPCATTRAVVL